MNKNNANNEVNILTHAIMLAGSVVQAEKERRDDYLAQLKRTSTLAETSELEVHRELKRLALLTVNSAIRFVEQGKQSDAKLTQRNGQKAAKELGRLKRLAERIEREANG